MLLILDKACLFWVLALLICKGRGWAWLSPRELCSRTSGLHTGGFAERLFWSCCWWHGASPDIVGRRVAICVNAQCSETTGSAWRFPFLLSLESEARRCHSTLGQCCFPTNVAACTDSCHLSLFLPACCCRVTSGLGSRTLGCSAARKFLDRLGENGE